MLVRGVRRLLTRQAVYASCAWVANEMVQAGRHITELTSNGSTLVRPRTLIRHLALRLKTRWTERCLILCFLNSTVSLKWRSRCRQSIHRA